MTRRITLTMVGVVAGALVVAGLGALLLIRLGARSEAKKELASQAQRLAGALEDPLSLNALRGLGAALRLEGQSVVRIGGGGRIAGELPAGVAIADLQPARLRAGHTVSGVRGNLAFAAAPARRAASLFVVVLTRRADTGRHAVGVWFLLASVATLVVAAIVAANLGRRLTRPLREAQAATDRIAAGDLAARVAEQPGVDDELGSLGRSINSMALALERSQGMERQFLLSVSHDLRTPLTSIRGFAEALAEGRATDATHAGVVISAEARRLERLVRDLLELAKLDARRFTLHLRSTDVAEVAADTTEGFQPAADEAGLDLSFQHPRSDAVLASADPDRLAQIVSNLVENALKFASAAIRVSVEPTEDGAVVWVEDDGPGIAPGDLPHVFERFYTTGRAPTRQVGSGLGLAIVAELTRAMGGDVRAEPAQGGGTRIAVSLRRSAEAMAAGTDHTPAR